MERLSHEPFNDPGARFALDNLTDGVKDNSLLAWEAHDTREDRTVWVLGRKIKNLENGTFDVLPCAVLLSDSLAAVRRYAPAAIKGGWDYSQISRGK